MGKAHMCVVIDGTIRRFPLVKMQVTTPYYVGVVEVMLDEEASMEFGHW